MTIRIDTNGLYIEGTYYPLYAGSVHYWRHPQEAWKPLLERIKDIGFDLVSVEVPWGVHETGPAIHDFGSRNPSKNLPVFLDTCRECGLHVLLRFGPFHDADLPWAGLPLRIARNSSNWAVTGSGAPALTQAFPQPFPIPSLAGERLFQEFGKFLDVLCPIIAPRQDPDGPVVLCQAGGTCDLFRRYKAYDIDYSADAVLFFRRFLSEKYGTIDALNEAYGTKYEAMTEVHPPKGCTATTLSDLPPHLDWVICKENLVTESVQRIIPMLRDRGIHLPLYHAAASVVTPVNHHQLAASSEAQFLSLKMDYQPGRYRDFINQARFMSGTHRLPSASDFPSGARWTSSIFPSPADQEFLILSAVMFGVAGFQFQMIADRDRWTGAPITRDGTEREGYAAMFRRLRGFLDDHHVLEGKKICRSLILLHSDLERYRLAISDFDSAYLGLIQLPRPFSELTFNFGFLQDPFPESLRHTGRNWISDLIRLLESQQVEFNISDTNASLDVLTKYDTVFLPTCDFLHQAQFEKLIDFVDRGGHLVMGPGQPYLNNVLQPLMMSKVALGQVVFRYEKLTAPGTVSLGLGKITWQPDATALTDVISTDMQNKVLHDNPELYLTIREGQHHLVFLSNPTGKLQKANLVSSQELRGIWNLPNALYSGTIQSEIQPYSVQVWEVVS